MPQLTRHPFPQSESALTANPELMVEHSVSDDLRARLRAVGARTRKSKYNVY